MKKTIWYLNHYAGGPSVGPGYRPYSLTREFKTLGFEAYIISASFHHYLYQDKTNEQQESIKYISINDIPYIRLKTPIYHSNGLKRIYNMFSYALKICTNAKKLIKITGIPSVIIVSSPHPLHYLSAKYIANKYSAKLIFEVRDLWPLSISQLLGVSSMHPFLLIMGWLEKQAYKKSNFVVSLLPNAYEYMQTKGLAKEKFVHIPNGIDIQEVYADLTTDSDSPQLNTIKSLKEQGKFLLLYTGSHGIPNALDNLINAAAILSNDPNNNIHIVLVGQGTEKNRLIEKSNGLKNIYFLDKVPKLLMPELLALGDAGFIGWNRVPLYQYGISPNKVFDYMNAAIPIIEALDTTHSPVQAAGCGITVEAENPILLAQAITKLSLMTANERENLGIRGKEYLRAHHNYSLLARKYIELFD